MLSCMDLHVACLAVGLIGVTMALRCSHDTTVAEAYPDYPTVVRFSHGLDSLPATATGGRTILINVSWAATETSYCAKVGDLEVDPIASALMRRASPSLGPRATQSYTCEADDVLTPDKRSMIREIVEEAIKQLSSDLGVRVEALEQRYDPAGSSSQGANEGVAVVATDSLVGPCDAAAFRGSPSTITLSPRKSGLHLFVTALGSRSAIPAEFDDMAWTKICAVDQLHRPVVAHLNFIVARLILAPGGTRLFHEYVASTVHQLVHSLGLSAEVMLRNSNLRLQTYNKRGKSVLMISSPASVVFARTLLQCPVEEGIELEDFDATARGAAARGTTAQGAVVTSHFEKRVLLGDLMNADGSGVLASAAQAARSPAALAFLEDTGFYISKWREAFQPPPAWLAWRTSALSAESAESVRSRCGFSNMTCRELVDHAPSWNAQMALPFCFPRSMSAADLAPHKSCSADRSGFGPCPLADQPVALPQHFQYFPSAPQRGGSDALADYCPMRSFQTCDGSIASQAIGNTNAANSRCLAATNLRSMDAEIVVDEVDPSAEPRRVALTDPMRCVRVRCTNGLRVEINPSNVENASWVSCPLNGSAADISLSSVRFVGTVHCPAAADVCRDMSLYYDEWEPIFELGFLNAISGISEENIQSLRTVVAGSLRIAIASVVIVQAPVANRIRMTARGTRGSVVLQALQSSIDSAAHPIFLQLRAATVTLVPGCGTVCSSTGSVNGGFATADHMDCECICSNRFIGPRCETCDFPFGGPTCDTCRDGYVNFPTCSSRSASSQLCPVPTDPFENSTSLATRILQVCPALWADLGESLSRCEEEVCLCLGGVYDFTRGRCNRIGFHKCLSASCDSQRAVCTSLALGRAVNSTSLSTRCPGAASSLRSEINSKITLYPLWCQHDACVSEVCPIEIRAPYCTAMISSAERPSPALVTIAAAVLVSFILSFPTTMVPV